MTSSPAGKASSRHDLNDEALGKWLVESNSIPGLKLPVVSTKIGYGQSNPTYFVDDAAYVSTLHSVVWVWDSIVHNLTLLSGTRFILRKKPSGTIISPVAHQVDREYRVIKCLGSVKGFPVPRVYALCMDPSVIGTAFYVSSLRRCTGIGGIDTTCQIMEFVKGRIITDPALEGLDIQDRRKA